MADAGTTNSGPNQPSGATGCVVVSVTVRLNCAPTRRSDSWRVLSHSTFPHASDRRRIP